mmetsp:Transcript_42854/g.99544  ORF Transcript_42854/g.99544 Transcript_42854/m.99544 type:complete len:342 (-) Transcript_42854:51-1076(-)
MGRSSTMLAAASSALVCAALLCVVSMRGEELEGTLGRVALEGGASPSGGMCDKGMEPGSKQSPIAIVQGPGGNVDLKVMPNIGWVGHAQGGLFRVKSPNTDPVSGKATQPKRFVRGNQFDMAEVDATLEYGGSVYKLDKFVLKTPSEHTIDGHRFAMEQQLMHSLVKAAPGKQASPTLIVSALFDKDPVESPAYVTQLYNSLDCMREGIHCHQAFSFAEMARTILYQTQQASKWSKVTYDYTSLSSCLAPPCSYGGPMGDHTLPTYVKPGQKSNRQSYFRYQGSLTDFPCTEGVEWLVLRNALPIADKHAEELRLAFGEVARGVQPDHGRVVDQSVFRITR